MLRIYNTLTRKKEEFKPITPGKVLFYQCGPTVYWTQHIGNLRAMTMADLIRRSLQYLGHEVTFVRNYTDVGHLTSDQDEGEDKMDKGARAEGKTPLEVAQKYIGIFENDTKALNILEPTYKPRATEYIEKMREMVQILLDKGFAYITSKAIYFDVSKAKDYTRLSGQKFEQNIIGAGSGDVSDQGKKHPADFALWFFKTGIHANALQTWPFDFAQGKDSPRGEGLSTGGRGFPGWHIECSAMIKSLLGDTIDIHMGGVEHIPVHHTNEIAQSESANGVTLANYWLHNEHLTVNGGKMAKSEGTGFALGELIEKGYDPLSLRYFFLQAHYRSKQNFTFEGLDAAATAYRRLQSTFGGLQQGKGVSMVVVEKESRRVEFQNKFREALEDNFNIPQALALGWEVVKSSLGTEDKRDLLIEFDQVLGLGLGKVIQVVQVEQVVQEMVMKREEARSVGNYQEADRLRGEIEKSGYVVKDTPQGSKLEGK